MATDRVEGVTIARNELVAGPEGTLRAHTTDEREMLEAGLVLPRDRLPRPAAAQRPVRRAVGADPQRRRPGPATRATICPADYVVGWIKRGPSGVIGTNKKDALETVKLLLEDYEAGRLPTPTAPHGAATEAFLLERRPDLVTYEHWQEIDAHEKGRGEPANRPRVKLTRVEEMLDVLGRDRAE